MRAPSVTFPQALFLLFLHLRLTGQIDWAWYLVATPLIVGGVAYLALPDDRRAP